MSSVNVEPDDPMNTFDMAQIVLSSMASTFGGEREVKNLQACREGIPRGRH